MNPRILFYLHNNLFFYFPGSSSRKLAKTLQPKESNRGHLEVAPRQSIEKKSSPTSSQSFIREEAPHTTRIPAPLWNKRRPPERPARLSSDRRRESFRDRGHERDRVSERYSQEQTFGGRGRERDRVSERYGQARTFGDRQVGKTVTESKNDDTRYLAYKQYVERRDSRLSGKCSVSCHKIAKDLTLKINCPQIHLLTQSQTHQMVIGLNDEILGHQARAPFHVTEL
jgi:hypothetical protein